MSKFDGLKTALRGAALASQAETHKQKAAHAEQQGAHYDKKNASLKKQVAGLQEALAQAQYRLGQARIDASSLRAELSQPLAPARRDYVEWAHQRALANVTQAETELDKVTANYHQTAAKLTRNLDKGDSAKATHQKSQDAFLRTQEKINNLGSDKGGSSSGSSRGSPDGSPRPQSPPNGKPGGGPGGYQGGYDKQQRPGAGANGSWQRYNAGASPSPAAAAAPSMAQLAKQTGLASLFRELSQGTSATSRHSIMALLRDGQIYALDALTKHYDAPIGHPRTPKKQQRELLFALTGATTRAELSTSIRRLSLNFHPDKHAASSPAIQARARSLMGVVNRLKLWEAAFD